MQNFFDINSPVRPPPPGPGLMSIPPPGLRPPGPGLVPPISPADAQFGPRGPPFPPPPLTAPFPGFQGPPPQRPPGLVGPMLGAMPLGPPQAVTTIQSPEADASALQPLLSEDKNDQQKMKDIAATLPPAQRELFLRLQQQQQKQQEQEKQQANQEKGLLSHCQVFFINSR